MAIIKKRYMKLLFFTALLMIIISLPAKASHEQGSARLSYPNVLVSNGMMIQDNKYPVINAMPSTSTWGFYDKTFTNKIMLGIDRYGTNSFPDFVATVTVQVSATAPAAMGGATTVFTTALSVSYEGVNNHRAASPNPSIDLSVFSFSNGYKVSAQVLNIGVTSSSPAYTGSTLPANVYLQLETDAERFYDLPFNASPFATGNDVSIKYIPASDEYEIAWLRINGAEQYDLEWLWLDGERNSYWISNPQIDFRNNSTRVRTCQQSYRVSNIFEKGQVFFRIRGVGKAGTSINTYNKDACTPWSWQDLTTLPALGLPSSSTVTSVAAPSTGTDYLFYITIDGATVVNGSATAPPIHESLKNWQYKSTYAEEGKKKEVISYFDGTLRSRQSVTKNNSDNNAIVGETFYDYNGRATVQALPVPVQDATIKFYQYNVTGAGKSGFNIDNVSTPYHLPYGKGVFDQDAATGSTVCAVFAAGLDPDYGSSKYYSDHNLNWQFAQGYVPMAENFPISQTEFTNDNTGRIAKQGGVGKNHQLGTGHETKYFYGSPVQDELDRLFGSEVGFDKHYKKNMVVDANGQVSISYLDQEGRTVATALAGQSPSNLAALKDASGNLLYQAPTATNVINANLLNKAGTTDYDTPLDDNDRVGDALTFSKKILVPTAGTYTVSYDLQGTSFTYSCLPVNTCYDCVYDLEINIFDNCMNNPPGFTKVTQTLGNILPPSAPNGTATPTYSLDAVCNQTVSFSTSQLSYSGNQLLVNLQQGEYTITKTLKMNNDAVQFYLNDYLKSSCVKTLSSFQTGIKPDTSGCNLTCDACVAALGTMSTYTAAGKGSPDDWLAEYQTCKAPCEYVSICDAEYITMLADVSPGGQYGDWQDNNGVCNPALYNLSVYNEGNLLPTIKNFTVGIQTPNWRNPILRTSVYSNTVFTAQYKEEDGTLSKVFVTKTTSTDYMPPITGAAVPVPVITGNTNIGDQFTVKPQELANVSDFIANWKNSWAASLVFYHPEYGYYDWCLKNSTMTVTPYPVTIGTGTATTTNSISTSDNYDSLLLINDNVVGLLAADLDKLCNPLTYDPYWSTNGYYYKNAASPTQTVGLRVPQYTTGGGALAIGNPWSALYFNAKNRYNNYQNSMVSLPAFVGVITTSCAIQYGQSIGAQVSCLMGVLNSTPGTLITTTTTVNSMTADQIIARLPANLQNNYWDNFRMMYLSFKQQLQQEAAESYAMNGDYRGCNDAIGDPSFDPMSLQVPFTQYNIFGPFFTFPGTGTTFFTNFYQQWFFPFVTANTPQYSNLFTAGLYGTKLKRFPNAKNATDLNNGTSTDPGPSIYANTGLCPNAFYFQNLLNALGVNNELTSPTLNLSTIPEFNKDLYTVVANSVITSSFTPANWTASSSALSLTASMQVGSVSPCPLTLTFPSGYPFDFSNTGNGGTYAFLKIYHLTPGTTSGGTSNFTVRADVSLTSGSALTFTTVTLNGTTCIPLTGCSFTPPCKPTTAAIALQKLMNAIASTGCMCTNTVVSMSNPSIQPYFLNTFGPLLGPGNWQWQVNGALPNFIIKDVGGTSTNSITITFAASPCTAGSSFAFANITGNNSAVNAFNISVNTVPSGSATVNSTATTGTVNLNGQPLKMGSCSFDIAKCNTIPHQVREDMEAFLTLPATRAILQSSSYNLTSNFNFGFNLRSRLSDNYQTYNTTALTTNTLYYYYKNNAAASTSTLLTGSFVASTLTSVPGTLTPAACGFTLQFANPGSLTGQSLLSPNTYMLSNFVLASGPMVNTSVYNFSVTATFSSTPFILNGTSSCFDMRACSECVSPSPVSTSQTLNLNDYNCSGSPTFSISENIGGAVTPYPDRTNSCASSTLSINPQYALTQSNSYLDNHGNILFIWNGYNSGSSLFIKRANGNEFKYQQQYSYVSECPNFEVRFKLHNHGTPNGTGTYTLTYTSSDFSVSANSTPLGLISSYATVDPNWTEYRFGNGTNVNGVPNNIQLYGFNNPGDPYVGLDELRLVTIECSKLVPCVAVGDSIPPFPQVEYEDPCVQYALDAADNEAQELYNAYIDSVKNEFVKNYNNKCIGNAVENMYMKYNAGDYHFTLYYYDQAGNLVRTVPPAGVHVETSGANLATIKAERAANTAYAFKTYYTTHSLLTTYTYNSLNQLVKQQTPDAGNSQFWYDALGRLVASQNAKQKGKSTTGNNYYSYTRYDYLGRIAQVGEMLIFSDFSTMTNTTVAMATSVSNYPDNLTSTRFEVTSTYYGDDASYTPLVPGSAFTAGSQQYLRSRVAAVTIEDTYDGIATTYNHGTHYSYDVHGNVKELVQENKDINLFTYQPLKKINYTYDLISGKVNTVNYQPGLADMFMHRYEYDADNRITAVYSSKNNVVWDRDAKYFYYLHGPLARVETGHDKVQGTDYAYTLQGWIKGINSNILASANDIGKDANGTLTSASSGAPYISNKFNATDVFGYSLTYFNNAAQKDYMAINATTGSATDFVAAAPTVQSPDLYNGNIRQMVTSYADASAPGKSYALSSLLRNFAYDQLNRVTGSNSNNTISSNAWGTATGGSRYKELFSYDENGNIITVQRNGDQSANLAMDNLTYNYVNGTNILSYVNDAVTADPYTTDISNQSTGNYGYDAIGNLTKDISESIANIDWTVYGKIKNITFGNGKPNLLFKYDASGNRISKTAYLGSSPSSTATTTYYARDAQGNVMAVYTQAPNVRNVPQFTLSERHIYGSSRLGLESSIVDLTGYTNTAVNTATVTRTLNFKSYEMSNHLGNVLAVVSDRKIAVANGMVCKTCQDIKTVYDAFIVSNTAVTPLNIGAFKTYANSQLSLNSTQADYEKALIDCKLHTNVLTFNGSTSVISNSAANLNLANGNVSAEAWINIQASTSGYNMILNNVGVVGSAIHGIQLFTYNNQLYFAAYDGGTTGAAHIGSVNTSIIPYGQWVHVAATKTGSGPAAFAMYVNGVSVSFTINNTDLPDATGMNNINNLEIGWEHINLQYAKGFYRNIRIYNRSLSGTEVAANYSNGCITEPGTSTGLIYYAKLNEGNGATIYDDAPAHLNATQTNGAWTYKAMPGSSCLTTTDLSSQLCYFIPTTPNTSISYFTGEVLSANDYYAFGSTMPGRSFTSGNRYRYTFNGKESDPETVGTGGGTQDYGMRIYNPALGRFLSVDPLGKDYSYKSPYDYAENDVIRSIDLDGEEKLIKTFVLEEYKFENGKVIKNKVPVIKINNPSDADVEIARRVVAAFNLPTTGFGNIHYGVGGDYIDYFVDGKKYRLDVGEGLDASEKQAAFTAKVVNTYNQILGIASGLALEYSLGKVFSGSKSSSAVLEEEAAIVESQGVNLELKMKPGWTAAQKAAAIQKAEALTSAETVVVKVVQRAGNTRGRFKAAGGVVKKGEDVDHVVDLQLSGADDILNMKALDQSVNRSMGAQIQQKIKALPAGTKINKVTIN